MFSMQMLSQDVFVGDKLLTLFYSSSSYWICMGPIYKTNIGAKVKKIKSKKMAVNPNNWTKIHKIA